MAENEETKSETEETPKVENFVVLLAYESTDGDVEENFGRLVEDLKLLYSFRQNVRVYALIERAADEVLELVENSKKTDTDSESSGG